MHELSICKALFGLVLQEHASGTFARVSRVRVEIGAFSSIDTGALRQAFDVLSRGTLLDGAVFEIDQPPGRALCLDCGADVALDTRLADCPACGGSRLRPTGGDQMRLIEMDVS